MQHIKYEMNKTIKQICEDAKYWDKEKIKEEYIKYMGKEAWEKDEVISSLISFEFYLSETLGIDMLYIRYEDIEDDSRIIFKEECIVINTKYAYDLIESAKCLAHEYRHAYQLCFVKENPDDIRAQRMKKEFENPVIITDYNDQDQIFKYVTQEIEIDAFAYTQLVVQRYYRKEITHPDKNMQLVIEAYKRKYLSQENI